MNEFNVATLNCRGAIKNLEYQCKLKSFFELNNLNIVFLQETHVNNLEMKKQIDKKFDCDSYWSFGASNSRGVAILILKKITYETIRFQTDQEGRLISVDIKTELGEIRFISVYLPNDIRERKGFLRGLDHFLFTSMPLIVGGDWNFIENINLDKFGGNNTEETEGLDIFKT